MGPPFLSSSVNDLASDVKAIRFRVPYADASYDEELPILRGVDSGPSEDLPVL
jgi:hypothetical protein